MVNTFTELVGLFFWPDPIFVGVQAVQFVIGITIGTYHAELKLVAKQFVYEVNQFCNDTDTKLAQIIDRPNIHGLLYSFITRYQY